MINFPNAKINLGLNIVEKRSDGFHNIDSVFYPIGLCDALEVLENNETSDHVFFTSTGITIPGDAKDNLCVKAYHLIAKDYPLPKIKIHLHKHIPIGAGLGGGSSDAAFFIKLLNEKFEIGLSWGEMHHYAKQLGSDCSFFITNKPAMVKGKGDEFEAIDFTLSGYYIVVIYPSLHVNTAMAYSGVVPEKAKRDLENDILNLPIQEWKNYIKNDFEKSIFEKFPEIEKIKMQLYKDGALYAAMSGSGSSVYGVFKSETNYKNIFKNYFVWESKL